MSAKQVFIDGDQGTTGLEIHSRLRGRRDLNLVTLDAAHRKNLEARTQAINNCDIAILCLPDDAAREAVQQVQNPSVRIIDASSAHRLSSDWIYGFAEMTHAQTELIATAQRVSNPGCYPTGAIGLLRPLIENGLIPRDYPVSINAVSGYSGKGRAGIDEYENSKTKKNHQAYGLELEHKHIPEIQKYSGLQERPIFTPAYGNYRQGILLTIPLHVKYLNADATGEHIQECLHEHYKNSMYAHVKSKENAIGIKTADPQELNGTDHLQISVLSNTRTGHILLTAVFDNLGKGAAGAAVQNLNIMLANQI